MENFTSCMILKIYRNAIDREKIHVDIICEDRFIYNFDWHTNKYSIDKIMSAAKTLFRTHQVHNIEIPAEFLDIYNNV